jgi:predicted alpha/beta superfamily hydrolase
MRFPFFIGAVCLAIGLPFAAAADSVRVQIQVTVPKDTPPDSIFLAGNLPEVGGWKVDGVALKQSTDGIYSADLNLPRGETLKYKINRGMWETVEKDANGEEITDRIVSLDADKIEKITVASWADKGSAKPATPTRTSTVTGDVRYHEQFHSDILHNDRRLIVWLPPGYKDAESTRYPVLYLHDGQNVFDASTSFAGEWQADETADELIRAGKIQPIIMVAVANAGSARMEEYTPTADARRKAGGRGEQYAQFLITEVKPFIDRTYRTLPDQKNTSVAGSSLGGLISLYLTVKHADVFGQAAVMSPSLFWDDRQLLKEIQADPKKLKGERIWIDIGTAEESPVESKKAMGDTSALADALKQAGLVRGKDFEYLEAEGAKHNEAAWSARFGKVLVFLFGK